jgi:hypothetical protein
VLLAYLLRPGTTVYLGFTDERENLAVAGSPLEVVRSRNPGRATGRRVFVKLR